MEEVGELHVDWSHGAGVLHDPVFVHIRSIVVTGSAGIVQKVRRNVKKGGGGGKFFRVQRTKVYLIVT